VAAQRNARRRVLLLVEPARRAYDAAMLASRRAIVLGAALGLVSAGCALWPKTRTPPLASEARAPAFTLPDPHGKLVSLADLTRRGPAMIVFYRGFW
jgi:hypothetical protein